MGLKKLLGLDGAARAATSQRPSNPTVVSNLYITYSPCPCRERTAMTTPRPAVNSKTTVAAHWLTQKPLRGSWPIGASMRRLRCGCRGHYASHRRQRSDVTSCLNPADTACVTQQARATKASSAVQTGTYMTPEELSGLLQVPTKTLAAWRTRRTGPLFVRVGVHVRYPADAVAAWLDERRAEAVEWMQS